MPSRPDLFNVLNIVVIFINVCVFVGNGAQAMAYVCGSEVGSVLSCGAQGLSSAGQASSEASTR